LNRSLAKLATASILFGALAQTSLPGVASAAGPTFKLSTKTLAVNKPSKLFASHLQSKSVYYLLVAQPDLKHMKLEGLVGGGLTDAKGNLVATIKAPAKASCGRATLYAYKAKTKKMYPFTVTVSGCKAGKRSVPPPPPPTRS
jgi:hypothetical protein